MIWGGPIFSVSNGGDDDHGMNTAEIHDDEVEDNLYDATKSLDWSLSPMQQLRECFLGKPSTIHPIVEL